MVLPGAGPLTSTFEQSGSRSGPIFLQMLSCTGEESSILDCPHGSLDSSCDHTMDASVQCYGECTNPFVHADDVVLVFLL